MTPSLGKLAYKYIYLPTLPYRYNLKHYGLKGWLSYTRDELEMKNSARALPQVNLSSYGEPILDVVFLTGKKYWHQTIFCIQSLINQCGTNVSIKIYSDGTINTRIRRILLTYCPQITILSEQEVLTSLSAIIPLEKFPTLHFLRNWHPFFRRIIDIHITNNWALHLDSDMLFLKFPEDLVFCSRNKSACFMQEQTGSSYFVDETNILSSRYSITTLPNVNGGIIAYDGDKVDYEDLEDKAKILVTNYYEHGPAKIEQTLLSYILSKQSAIPLNSKEYKIFYGSILTQEENTLRHYIFKARKPYLASEWKKIV